MPACTIAVMDYGMGNLRSVSNAINKVSEEGSAAVKVVVSSDADVIRAADKIVFPGVGAMRDCMAEIRRLGFDELLKDVSRNKPVLAICVGMQALLSRSEENHGVDCIGLLEGAVQRFPGGVDAAGQKLKVPHMGWNIVEQTRAHPLWVGIDNGSRFYFVHSYYTQPADAELVYGRSEYGRPFAAALAQGNIFATQFHPEKSHSAGLQLYRNFIEWDGEA